MKELFVAYYRVSTTKQGIDGLGMDAQRHAVQTYLASVGGELIGSFEEVESGKVNSRPELARCIALAKKRKAAVCVARTDRLSRRAALLMNLRDSGLKIVAADAPFLDSFCAGILGLVAQREQELTSQRVKDALAAAKRRGTRLGNPRPTESLKRATAGNVARANGFAANLLPVVREIQGTGRITTLRGICDCLNARGFKTPRGCAFEPQSVKNLLARG